MKFSTGLTRQQWILIMWALIAGGSPVAAIAMKRFEMTPDDWSDWTNLFAILVSIVGGTRIVNSGSLASAAQYAKEMTPADQQVVAAGMDSKTKIKAAAMVPEVTVIGVNPVNGIGELAASPENPKVIPVPEVNIDKSVVG